MILNRYLSDDVSMTNHLSVSGDNGVFFYKYFYVQSSQQQAYFARSLPCSNSAKIANRRFT